jgi:hypothetical protein
VHASPLWRSLIIAAISPRARQLPRHAIISLADIVSSTTSSVIWSAARFAPATSTAPMAGAAALWRPYMLATPTAGLLPSARLLLPRAIREAGAGARNGPPCDATGARFCMMGVPAGALSWDRRSLRSLREIEAAW